MKIQNDFKLNVVPLIDVMLVLLTIVLCAASFIEYQKIDMNLPKADGYLDQNPQKSVEISLYMDGSIKLDGNLITLANLENHLKTLSKDTQIVFKGDEKSEFKGFIEIIELLKQNDLSNFKIEVEAKK